MLRKAFFLLTILTLTEAPVWAEFVCKLDIKYSWKKGEEEIVTPWASIERRGEKEDEVKEDIRQTALRQSQRAAEVCRREHENVSGCIASKINAGQATLANLGFSARKALEESMAKDCAQMEGKCLSVKSEEIKCTEIKAAEPEAAAADPKKDDKKKKK